RVSPGHVLRNRRPLACSSAHGGAVKHEGSIRATGSRVRSPATCGLDAGVAALQPLASLVTAKGALSTARGLLCRGRARTDAARDLAPPDPRRPSGPICATLMPQPAPNPR